MPPEMRFCRSCGHRLGEGPAEYTETVLLPNGAARPNPQFSSQYHPGGPMTAAPDAGSLRRRRLGFSGTTWLWIVLVAFFAIGGMMSMISKRSGFRPPPIIAVSNTSYLGVNGLKSADGGATFYVSSPPGGPADKAGLVGGDIITSFDGHPVTREADLRNLLRQVPIGKTVEVVYTRDGNFHNTQLTTIAKDEMDRLSEAFAARSEGQGRFGFDDGDAKVVEIPGTKITGVELGDVEANLPADIAGIKKGDIITDFGDVPIRTVEELTYRVRRTIPYTTVTITLRRDGQKMEIPVKLGRR